jgi:hypothetical protein
MVTVIRSEVAKGLGQEWGKWVAHEGFLEQRKYYA